VRTGPYARRTLDPCAYARTGEGLFGVTGVLRRELHYETNVPLGRCVPPERQISFFLREFPRRYPECAAAFFAGRDMGAVSRCWGKGRSR